MLQTSTVVFFYFIFYLKRIPFSFIFLGSTAGLLVNNYLWYNKRKSGLRSNFLFCDLCYPQVHACSVPPQEGVTFPNWSTVVTLFHLMQNSFWLLWVIYKYVLMIILWRLKPYLHFAVSLTKIQMKWHICRFQICHGNYCLHHRYNTWNLTKANLCCCAHTVKQTQCLSLGQHPSVSKASEAWVPNHGRRL